MFLNHLLFRMTYIRIFVILLIPTLWVAYFFAAGYNIFALSTRPSHLDSIVMPLVESPSEVQYNLRAADVVIPKGVKIIGLVFYGRRDYVKILECYLKVSSPI